MEFFSFEEAYFEFHFALSIFEILHIAFNYKSELYESIFLTSFSKCLIFFVALHLSLVIHYLHPKLLKD